MGCAGVFCGETTPPRLTTTPNTDRKCGADPESYRAERGFVQHAESHSERGICPNPANSREQDSDDLLGVTRTALSGTAETHDGISVSLHPQESYPSGQSAAIGQIPTTPLQG